MGRVREEEEGRTEGVAKRVRKRIEEVEGESRRRKSKSRTLQGNCKERKEARLPEAEDEKERSLIQVWSEEDDTGERKKVEGVEYAKRKRRHEST